ncbi:hypothetical protein M3M33_13690, partial [Loigolactobacillus coryniformis]|uniref:hypothetical protein n=1 Tax=Loigolactobacillus coryniformis TaxID=1610 RepID=UPI00201B0729
MKTFLFILFIILAVVLSTVLDLWFNHIPSMIGGYTIALFITTLILNYMERQLAMNWWNELSFNNKIDILKKNNR